MENWGSLMSEDYKIPYIKDKATRSAVYFALKMKNDVLQNTHIWGILDHHSSFC